MNAYVKRAGNRSSCEAPIMWADSNTENYYPAKTYNSSENGMYFESDHAPKSKTKIRIKTLNYLPNTNGPEAFKFYEAKVKWCRNVTSKGASRYGVGVQYLIKSQYVEVPDYPCSLCGENVSSEKIHSVEEFVYLCSPCFDHFQSLPDGMVKKSIKDFLIGNVI